MRGIFNLICIVSSLHLTSVQASPAANVQRRGCRTASDPSCDFLLQRCVANPGFWGSNDCVAAATCSSVATVLEAASCSSPSDPKSLPTLNYNLYAGIVGKCAWAKGGCPITPQNYVDFYFRTLSSAGSKAFPDLNKVRGWWNPISSWANKGPNVPYTNFNDWLHFSSRPVVVVPPPGGGGGGSGGGGGGTSPPPPIVVPPPGGGGTTRRPSPTGTPTPPQDCNFDEPNIVKRTIDISDQTVPSLVNITRRVSYNYIIDCNAFPNVCENQCYYVFCKGGSWVVHIERTPASRRDTECAGYNRCSHGRSCGPPPNGWQVNPNADWSCDEQPKSSAHEGGAGSATRCMPKGENSGEGSLWGNFINGKTDATNHVRLADGEAVTVFLQNVNHHGYCASYGGSTGKTVCGTAASPPGANDAIRQR